MEDGSHSAGTWRRVLPGAIVSAAAVALLVWVVDLDGVAEAFQSARPDLLAAVLPLFFVSLLCRALAWHTLLSGRATVGQAFFVLNQAYLVHNLLPLRLGEVARCYLLTRLTGARFFSVVPTVAIERLFDVLIAVALLLGTIPFVWGAESSRTMAMVVGGAVGLALVLLVVAARHRERLSAAVQRWRWLPASVRPAVKDALGGLAVLSSPGRSLVSFLCLASSWALAVALSWLLLRAFVPSAELLHAAFGSGVVAMGIAVPSSPANAGVFEAAWVGALALCGIDQSPALAFAITSHVLMVGVTAIFAVWGFIVHGTSMSGLFQEIRTRAESWRGRRPA